MQETTCLEKQPLSQEMLEKMDAYWRASNYLSAGQLYLLDNPLLKEPLTMDHIKKKIVGHWGTVPGQNFVYVHCNRAIKRYDLDMILLSGPGHGGNFLIANTCLLYTSFLSPSPFIKSNKSLKIKKGYDILNKKIKHLKNILDKLGEQRYHLTKINGNSFTKRALFVCSLPWVRNNDSLNSCPLLLQQ